MLLQRTRLPSSAPSILPRASRPSWESQLRGSLPNSGPASAPRCPFHALQDIELMRSLGIRNFRMSLSWPRLFPNGTGQLNQVYLTVPPKGQGYVI